MPDFPLIYGTAWKAERTAALVSTAFTEGFRAFDTACQPKHYNEAQVGDALQQQTAVGVNRTDFYLQTKFTPLSGQDPNRVPYDPDSSIAEQVQQSFACSRKNLRTDYVDALLLHSPLPTLPLTLDAWAALEEIHRNGGAHSLGISNCYNLQTLKALYDAAQVKPSIVQNRFYADTGYDVDLRAWCQQQNIQYQSFWTLTANPYLLAAPALHHMAQTRKASAAQILFSYLRHRGVTPLTGTTNPIHMRQDLAITDIHLENRELVSIDRLLVHFSQ